MAEQNPTVIIAHLDDEKLRKSIDSLVGYVDEKFKAMTTSTTNAVNTMQNELQKLGSLNAKGVGGSGGGELGITKALQRAKQEAKESSMTFDQMAASMQKATTGNGNKTIFSTMDTEISILKERLVEAKSQVESFTVMARRGAETGDKGLFTFSTENLHKYEAEVATLTQQINSLTSQRQALKEMLNPQGDAFKNYVDSLTKANPELAALNAQYKEGKSLLQQQTDAVKEKTKVEETNAAEVQKTWEMEQKLHQEQGKRFESQNEINRQLEIENAKTAENLAFQERIDAVREAKEGGARKRVRETNELTGAIAGLLGIQEKEVAVTNVEGASQHRLANYLNQLKTAYQRLDKEGMSASHGKMLADEIQRVSRAYAEMTKQMNRPTSLKNALGLDENTLDRIAYKIQQLNAYRVGLNITNQKQVGEMRTVENEIDRLKKKQDELMGKNQQLLNSNNALARSWNYMKNRLAFYFTVGASTAFVKNLIEVRSQYEMNERALGILIDSAERGTQIFNELSQMALVSPYTLIELSSAAKQLTAYDVAAKDVVDTTRRLADMASAVGIPIERLTYALGQIKAYGYLNSRDARMFLNAGIPLVKNLADHYTELEGKMVSVGDVYDRMKKKAIGYNDVMQVITEMTDEGGKFFDFQAKMADTLKVQLANLTLAWNNMLNEIGASEQGILVGGIKMLKELFLQWNSLQRVITDVAVVIGIAKAAQVVLNITMGKGMATINQSILAYKNKQATMLEYQQLTRKLTADEMALVATRNRVTSADYKQILSSKGVTKANALMMASFQKTNIPLMLALRRMNLLTAAELRNASVGKGVVLAIKGIGVALKGVWATMTAMAPSLLITGLIMGAVEALQYYSDQAEKTRESNKNIADGAKEASDAIKKFIAENKKGLGNISEDEAQKVWMALRDQIELSSSAAESFVTELLKEEDINKRLEKGFDYADRIQRSTNALAGLKDTALKVSQDSVFGGLFGEGLAEDLEDYIESVQKLRSLGYDTEARNFDRQEAEREMIKFADDVQVILQERLGDAGLADPVQVREAVERIKQEVKAANPQIKGEVEKYFDVNLDQLLGERLGVVYDKSYSLQKMLIERIKRDSGAALKGLSDDILDTSKELDDNVVDAIEKAFEKLEKDLPAEQRRLLADLQKTFNENPLTLRYILREAADVDIRDAVQKDFDEHFGLDNANKPLRPKKPIMADFSIEGTWATDMNAYGKAMEKYNKEMEVYNSKMATYDEEKASRARVYAEFNKKEGEDRVKWGKRILDAEKEANEQAKAAAHTQQQVKAELGEQAALTDERYKAAVKDEEAAVERANAARTAYNYEHLYNEEKTKGSSGTKKDEFGDALAKEVQYISDIQKRFKEYQKMGVDAQHALTLATDEYGKSIIRNNAILQKYGVKTLSSEQLATMPLQEIRDFYQEQLKGANLSAKGVEALEKAIANLNVEITKVDYKRITDGLNNELSKIKDEYELAVELDANPELGGAFADLFGINTDELPKTFSEAFDRANKAAKEKLSELKVDVKDFDLLSTIIKGDDKGMWMGHKLDSEPIQKLIAKQKEWRDMLKKNLTETEKALDDYVKKYGGYSDKIAEIEADRIEKIKRLNDAYYTEEMRKLPEYIAKLNAIEQGAIREKGNAGFEDFKNSRLYVQMFEDLRFASTATLETMRDKLSDLKSELGSLTPEQLKQVTQQFEKIEQELMRRNPFKGFTTNAKNYLRAIGKEGKEAQKNFRNAQKEYDTQQKVLATIKTKLKQAEAAEKPNKENIDYLKEELGIQQGIVDKLYEQLMAAAELNEKFNLFKKIFGEEQAGAIAKWGQVVASNLQSLGELRDFIQQDLGVELSDELNGTIDGLTKVGEGINSIVSSATSGNVVGVIAGVGKTVYGLYDSIASIFGGGSAGDKKISRQIEESERHVKALEISYQDLQDAMEDAYGYGEVAAKRATITNKELQLVELQRQLQLEKSRKKKNQDANRIMELQSAIINLRNELDGSTKDIVNDLLGISSVGDAAEQLVSSMIDAFKNGEDYMKVYEDSFEDMIDNLIMKAIVGEIVGRKVQQMFDAVEKESTKRADKTAYSAKMPSTRDMLEELYPDYGITEKNIRDYNNIYFNRIREAKTFEEVLSAYEKSQADALQRGEQNFYDMLQKQKEFVLSEYADAATIRPEDLRVLTPEWKESWMDGVQDLFTGTMDTLGITFGQGAEKSLSNLQQGIRGVTEETAGAIESYLNGMSQQVYYQSDILTQIRDTVQGFDLDVSLGVQSQMLLQLQNSYQTQQAIQQILEGVLVPSGQAVRVELLS